MLFTKWTIPALAAFMAGAAVIPKPALPTSSLSLPELPTVTLPSVEIPTVSTTSALSSTLSSATGPVTIPTDLLKPFVPNRATDAVSIADGKARAKTSSPTSNVPGLKFDRFVSIWLENTDFESAMADPNLSWLAQQGISLNNYYGIAHPSQPNYAAVVGGSQNRVISGAVSVVPGRVETIVDRLEAKGISWGEYQEGLPYSGFLGDFKNQVNGRNDYVRKHNPLASYRSVTDNLDRLSQIKNFTLFERDLAEGKLPQWMFITPNMTNDGHDSSVTVAGNWCRRFIEPLLTDERFMQKTLVVLTFDESERYDNHNQVYAVLLGDAVPENLRGVVDTTRYNHFSNLITVEKNWGLDRVLESGVGENNANAFYPFNVGGIVVQDHFAKDPVPDLGPDVADLVGDVVDKVI